MRERSERDNPQWEVPDEAAASAFRLAQNNVAKLFREFSVKNWGQLALSAYKCTPCGPCVGLAMRDGSAVNNTSQMCAMDRTHVPEKLLISSIVEGVYETAGPVEVVLAAPKIVDRFYKALYAVDMQASYIWRQTHGCEICAEHFGSIDGLAPIWSDCPLCKGEGVIL